MLTSLAIENYALIQALDLAVPPGMSIITGETGAGKSIILGALSLVLGQRADVQSLKDPALPCVVEAGFVLDNRANAEQWQRLQELFAQNDLDFTPDLLLRRVISPSGKSRAFLNDEPVGLQFLKALGAELMDIHSQHQHLQLAKPEYQRLLVDSFAQNQAEQNACRRAFEAWQELRDQYQNENEAYQKAAQESDYIRFQREQLAAARLEDPQEQTQLEQEQELLEHVAEVKQWLTAADALMQGEEPAGLLEGLRALCALIDRAAPKYKALQGLPERLHQVREEVRDIARECERAQDGLDLDPRRLEAVTERLDLLYSLEKRYRCEDLEALLAYRDSLDRSGADLEEQAARVAALAKALQAAQEERDRAAAVLHASRVQAAPRLAEALAQRLTDLDMPRARVAFPLEQTQTYTVWGNTRVNFLFSAQARGTLRDVGQVASGGELSRLMLAVKTLLAQGNGVATLIFDEIDQGVSGQTAHKMAELIRELSRSTQVLAITHLPQLAAAGDHHFYVYKETEAGGQTRSHLSVLDLPGRRTEIARMISGARVTEAALAQAELLLQTYS